MIKIELLKNHLSAISELAHIWHEVLGKIWVPDVPVERVITRFAEHLNDQALPITFIALDGDLPVGMCSLREMMAFVQILLLGSVHLSSIQNIKSKALARC